MLPGGLHICSVGMDTGAVSFPQPHITPELLRSATGCSAELAALYAPLLQVVCGFYGISTPQRLGAFLAQIGHESGALRYTSEIWGPTDAQRRYEGRADLGNTEPGDGSRYRGRGLIQTTGRHNYRALRDRLRARLGPDVPDFEAQPDRLAEPRWAAWSAGDYWDWRGLNELADRGDFITITRRINGGTNGLADRERRWELARAALGATAERPAPVEARAVPAAPVPPIFTQAPAAPTTESRLQDTTPAAPARRPATADKERPMALPAILAAVLPTLIGKIPELVAISNAKGDDRKERALQLAADVAVQAVGAPNLQAAAEAIQADPQAAATARAAVRERWADIADLIEAGSGGIDGARKADLAARKAGDLMHSPSFWIAICLLPLVYMVTGNVVGLWGDELDDQVRSAIAASIVSLIVGGLMGYYYGQTTSRNRGPVPPQ